MFVASGDARIYTVEFGAAPRTLLAFGGWAGSWELWARPFSSLCRTWRAVAYDHRGSGYTVAPTESITLDAMVADVYAVMDALGIERCVLAAESAGAAVAIEALLRRPERFDGLVVAGAMYHRAPSPEPSPFVRALRADYPATIGAFVDACLPEPDTADLRRWGRQLLGRSSPADAVRLYESLDGLDLRPQLGRIARPALVLHGEADAIVPVAEGERLAAAVPGSRLHVVRGAGHVPTVTRGPEVAEAIDAFFASYAG